MGKRRTQSLMDSNSSDSDSESDTNLESVSTQLGDKKTFANLFRSGHYENQWASCIPTCFNKFVTYAILFRI